MNKWFKIFGLVTVVTVVGLLILGSVAFAQGPRNGTVAEPGINFVDQDGDGLCDTCGAEGQMMGRMGNRANGAYEAGFVDLDGDGLCDNCGSDQPANDGINFVDEDADGVCDNYGTYPQVRQGRGRTR